MCLIIHSKTGALPAKADFWEAAKDNPDGIGIMSADGVEKFLGRKSTRKAWKYLESVSRKGLPFGVHFRWATHGEINRSNAHPFKVPEVGAYLMHNGILWTSKEATDKESDTAIFARRYLPTLGDIRSEGWRSTVFQLIGHGNKLLVMSADGSHFEIVNQSAGTWIGDGSLWYSNTYSIVSIPSWELYGQSSYASATRRAYANPYATAYDYGTRGEYPSGPTMADDAYDVQDPDYASDRAWWRESMAAKGQSLESAVKARAFPTAAKQGFDWHNPDTWLKYPIPGTEHRVRTVRAFGDGERPDALADEEQRLREELDIADYRAIHGVDPYV